MSDVLYTHWQLLEWLTIDSVYTNCRIGRQEVTSWSNPTQDFASFFNVVSTILFSLDILFNFRTAYVVSHVPRCAPYPTCHGVCRMLPPCISFGLRCAVDRLNYRSRSAAARLPLPPVPSDSSIGASATNSMPRRASAAPGQCRAVGHRHRTLTQWAYSGWT